MSIYSFNNGLDDGYCGKFPDEKRMLNDRDYFEGYCMAEDIEERYEYERKCEEDYEEYLKEQQDKDFKEWLEKDKTKKMKIEKRKECLECGNVYIDCRDLLFCTYKGIKYIGRKKDYTIPSWCPFEDYKEADHENPN